MRPQFLPARFPLHCQDTSCRDARLGVDDPPVTFLAGPDKHAADERLDRAPEPDCPKRYLQRVLVRRNHRVASIALGSVDWMRSARNYVNLHCGEHLYKTRVPLTRMAKSIDPKQFLRIHRSVIVNIGCVEALLIERKNKTTVQLRSGVHLTVSRKYRFHVRSVLGKVACMARAESS